MKTIAYTVTKNLYEFSELSESTKETAKQDYLDSKEAWEFEEIVKEDLRHLFPDSELSVQFSLGYCQSDGLNIYGFLSKKDCLHIAKEYGFSEKEAKRLDFYLNYCSCELPENTRRSYCKSEEFKLDLYELESHYHFKNVDWDLIESFEDSIKKEFRILCRQYQNEGYNFFYECSDEEMEDAADANEWLFDEYGHICYM